MKFVFVKAEHPRYGGEGLALKGMEFAEAGAAMTCCHDIMEHFPGDEGNAEGELMALGASFYTRGESYHFIRASFNCDPAWHMQAEWYNILDYLLDNGDVLSWELKNKKLKTQKLDDERAEDWIQWSAEMMVTYDNIEEAHEQIGVEKWMVPIIKHNIIAYMRKGYRKARDRYQGQDTYDLAYVFHSMEQEMEKKAKHMEKGFDELHVTFSYSKPHLWEMKVVSVEEEGYNWE